MLRRTLTVGLAALALLAGAAVDAKGKKKEKKDPTEGLTTHPKYGLAVDYRWQPSVTKYASLEGKVYNRSQNTYINATVLFILWAKDGDKIEEYRFRTGLLPPGASVKIPLVALGDGRDKPDRLELYGAEVVSKDPIIPYLPPAPKEEPKEEPKAEGK